MIFLCPIISYHIPWKTPLYQPYVVESHVPVTTNQNKSCSRHRDDPVNAAWAMGHIGKRLNLTNWLPSGYLTVCHEKSPFLSSVNHLFLWAIYTMAMLNNQMVVWNSWNQLTVALEMGKLPIMTMNNHPIHPFPLGHPAAATAPALSMQTLRVLGSRIFLQWAALANSLFMFSVIAVHVFCFDMFWWLENIFFPANGCKISCNLL